jgi:hypothetical protein
VKFAMLFGLVWSLAFPATVQVGHAPEHGDVEESHLVGDVPCGIERWNVKTLQDRTASQVRLAVSKPAKIALMRVWLPPKPIPPDRRVAPVETTRWAVTARLVEMKFEADSDVHLVIADPITGGSMIAEFPDPGCTKKASSGARALMTSARAALLREEGTPSRSRWKKLRGLVKMSGVGFFDYPHGQTGVAPNAIELHPVLSFVAVG